MPKCCLPDECGQALILKSPVLAQLFIHAEPASPVRLWRISQSTQIPRRARGYSRPKSQSHCESRSLGRVKLLLRAHPVHSRNFSFFGSKPPPAPIFREIARLKVFIWTPHKLSREKSAGPSDAHQSFPEL